LTQPIVRGIFF